jgi:hypothetical protein
MNFYLNPDELTAKYLVQELLRFFCPIPITLLRGNLFSYPLHSKRLVKNPLFEAISPLVPTSSGSLPVIARVLTSSISSIIMMRGDSDRHEATSGSRNWLQSRDRF